LPNSFANRIVCFNPHPSRRTGATLFGAQQHSAHRRVSILTRPEGRVQHGSDSRSSTLRGFQSSPVPKDGCNRLQARRRLFGGSFNPHPSRRTGATQPQHWVFCSVRRFNPHPSRRTGATYLFLPYAHSDDTVSILTRPEGRVQLDYTDVPIDDRPVSILTRPEGRVQLDTLVAKVAGKAVSILTRPEGRVQPPAAVPAASAAEVSILTRPEGRVQQRLATGSLVQVRFQSSPVPKDGCN